MSQIKNYVIFEDLCLVCGDFQCEEESFHIKFTLKQVQSLLTQQTLVQVSIEFQKAQQKLEENLEKFAFGQSNHLRISSNYIKSSKLARQTYGISKCVQKIQTLLQNKCQNSQKINLRPSTSQNYLNSLLGTIYCMQIIQSKPLIYHDIHQLIILIGRYKWHNDHRNLNGIDFPFTRQRINRAIKYIKQSLQRKKKTLGKLSKLNQNKQNNQNKQKKNLINISTSGKQEIKCISNPQIKSNFKAYETDKSNFMKYSPRQIVESVLKQQRTFNNILARVNEINSSCIFLSNEQMQRHLFCIIFEQVCQLQYKLLQSIKRYNITINLNTSLKRQLQSQTNVYDNIKNNIKQTEYAQSYNLKQFKQQQVEIIQFVSIEGIPFPSNRKGIDFSLFHIDDRLLLNYMPAMEKFKDLEELCLRINTLTPLGYKMIKNAFPNLRSLDLRQNILTKQIVQVISQMKSLNILYISDCQIDSASLVKICLNLDHLNFLYCDNLSLHERDLSYEKQNQNMDYRSIFYIMCLNMKKLLYLSVKGYFCSGLKKFMTAECQFKCMDKSVLNEKQQKQFAIVQNISQILSKRHGILQI